LMPSYAGPLTDLLGLRWILAGASLERIDPGLGTAAVGPPAAVVDRFHLVARTPDGNLYENPRALPRVLFATRSIAADFDQLITTGGLPAIDWRNTVLLQHAWPGPLLRPGAARIERYTNTRIEIAVDSPDGGWLVLNDIWHPWWFATVDGQPVPVLRANVLFRAVAVPAGATRVTFTFAPITGAFREITQRGRTVH
jgi:hypothetical protein